MEKYKQSILFSKYSHTNGNTLKTKIRSFEIVFVTLIWHMKSISKWDIIGGFIFINSKKKKKKKIIIISPGIETIS